MAYEQAASALVGETGIVVIGRNEGARLINCLHSVAGRVASIVYVDSGSTDGSVAAAERLGTSVVRMNIAQPFTAARARNEGFAALTVLKPEIRFVQFLDGDCELVQGWLDTALKFLAQRKDVVVISGRRRERYPDASVYNWLCDLEWDTPIGEAAACGGNSLVRVEVFAAVGGFQPQLMAGEEPEFCLRLRERDWKIWRLDAEMTRHDAAMTQFGQWWTRTKRGGYGFAEVFLLSRHSRFAIYKRELVRAVVWGGLLPLAILLGTLIHRATIAVTLIYAIQIGRIAWRRGAAMPQSWIYAAFMTFAKFAEFQGILKFFWRRWRGHTSALIEYKQHGSRIEDTRADI